MIPKPKEKMNQNNIHSIVFFGTDEFAVTVLDELAALGIEPIIIVTTPDKPKGRKLIITPPPTKIWAQTHNIEVLQPAKLDLEFVNQLKTVGNNLFLVASYGKIIPKNILEIPKYGVLNIHPSLLPKLRGPSPLQYAILEENETGVTIMRVDEEMDHGPIIAQKKVPIENWPPEVDMLGQILAREGARLFAEILPNFLLKKTIETPQDHSRATYTKKIQKMDGLIDLTQDPEKNYRKIQAYAGWPTAFFFIEKDGKKIRVIIKKARLENGKLVIEKVLPEGSSKEVAWPSFLNKLN